MVRSSTWGLFVVILLLVCSVLFVGQYTLAQGLTQNTTIASPIPLTGEVHDGDIISYNVLEGVYALSHVYSDETMFGVVVLDPVLYMATDVIEDGMYPVVRYGEATVNVSTVGGAIEAGDLITTSNVRGYGRRAERDNVSYVLGFALEPMTVDTTIDPVEVDDERVFFGRVPVALRIGSHVPGDLDDVIASSTALAHIKDDKGAVGGQGFDTFKAFRYVLAVLVALGAIFVALRKFGDMFAQSVVSVGRNPLARSQIRSILVWNALIIVMVSSLGLGVSAALIFLP